MAENNSIGEISFGVNADTGELLASTKVVDSATTKMANSFQELTKKIAGTESGSSKLAAQFGGAGKAAAVLENEIKRLGGQVQANGNVVDQFGVRNAKLTATLAQLRGATFQTTSSFRMMRGGIQQLGYQVQDIAVQLQMGQNPLMVLGQQGSQIASIFGAGGAVFGAILAISAAVGTAFLPALFGGKDALEQVTEAAEAMGKAIDVKDEITKFTDELERMSKVSSEAARSMLAAEMVKANETIAKSVSSVGKEFGDVAGNLNDAAILYKQYKALVESGIEPSYTMDASKQFSDAQVVYGGIEAILGKLNKQFKLTTDQSRGLLESFINVRNSGTPESILALEQNLVKLNNETGFASDKMTSFIDSMRVAFDATGDATKVIQLAELALRDLDGTIAANSKSVKDAQKGYNDLIKGLEEEAATAGMTARQLHLYQIEQFAIKAGHEEMIPLLKKLVNDRHNEIDAIEKSVAAEKARKQEIERGTKSLNDQIAQLAFKTETLGMDERQLAKHTAMQIINSSSLDVNTEAVMANLDALYDALEAKQRNIDLDKDLDNQTKNAVKTYRGYQKSLKDQQTALMTTKDQREAFIENIKEEGVLAGRNAGQINKLVEGYRALWAAQDQQTVEKRIEGLEKEIELQVLKNALTNEQFELEAALLALGEDATPDQVEQMTALIEKMQEARFASELLGEDIRTALQDVGLNALDNLSSGLANAIMQGDSLSETLKNVGRTMVGEMLTAAIRFFVGQAAASLMGISTTTGAAVAQAGVIASAMAPAATLANVATSGGAALAAAATMPIASAATASVMSLGSALGGGRLYGGRTEAGKMHPILEDGKPEMLTVGNKNYLMTPSAGMVTSNKDMTSGGGSMQSNNVNLSLNLSPNTPQEFRRQLFENQELVYSIVQRALNDRGRRF